MINLKKNSGAISDKKNILIITDSYPPEIRSAALLMNDLANGLSEMNHNIWVATLSYNENTRIIEENNIKVLRINFFSQYKINFIIRGISTILMPFFFFRAIKKNIKEKIDIVIVHSPPLSLTLVGKAVKKKYNSKFVLNLHDIFPQNAIDLKILKKTKHLPAIWFFQWMEKNSYKNADLIIVPSDRHKEFIENKRNVSKEKTKVVYHWIDIKPFISAKKTDRFRKLYHLEDKFIFLFGGTIGPSQGLDFIINIAKKLEDKKDIIFLFVGDGIEKKNLIKLIQKLKLKNVIFKPSVSLENYPELVKDCDVGLLSLTTQNTTPAVPAKILGYMAAAIPVVAFLHKESDALSIIEKAKCGYGIISDNEEKALKIILKIYNEKNKLKEYGENGLKYLLENMEKEVCVKKFEKLL